MKPSKKQIAMMRHASGDKPDGHRNRYYASEENFGLWDELRTAGLAVLGDRFRLYHVSSPGLDYLYGITRQPRDEEEYAPEEPVSRDIV